MTDNQNTFLVSIQRISPERWDLSVGKDEHNVILHSTHATYDAAWTESRKLDARCLLQRLTLHIKLNKAGKCWELHDTTVGTRLPIISTHESIFEAKRNADILKATCYLKIGDELTLIENLVPIN